MAFAPPRPWRMRSQTRLARSRRKSLHGRTRQPECAGEVAAGKRNAKRQYAPKNSYARGDLVLPRTGPSALHEIYLACATARVPPYAQGRVRPLVTLGE